MNFLAHLFLSGTDPDLIVGNLIADFLRNKDLDNYSKEVQAGIFLHRKIDSYTDNHPEVRKGTHRLQPKHHKYAPVVIDLFYDHLLVKNWSTYKEQQLIDYTTFIYGILESRMDEMPESLKKRLPNMIADNWLLRYGTIDGMKFVLEKNGRAY